jgi:hypothetical protein
MIIIVDYGWKLWDLFNSKLYSGNRDHKMKKMKILVYRRMRELKLDRRRAG